MVEVLPVDRPWGELLVNADDHLIPLVATCASIESLHRMTRQDRYIQPYIVPGSDHLTAYRLYQAALTECGGMGSVYGLPRHVFDPEALDAWAEERGVLVRSIEDAALALASIYRALELPLPATLPKLNDRLTQDWQRLLARVMPFDLVIDEETSWGEQVRVAPTSVCGRWGVIVGDLRYFSDRFGRVRGSIEGTQIPYDMMWEYAQVGDGEVVYDPGHKRAPLRLRSTRSYHGFELDSSETPLEEIPLERLEQAREALAGAMAAGIAYHRDIRANRETFRTLREVYRRSGGEVPEVNESVLTNYFLDRLAHVTSYSDFADTNLEIRAEDFVAPEVRRRWLEMPDTIAIQGAEYPLDYAIEDGEAVARARVPEKIIWQIQDRDVPAIGRPVRWTVLRGKKGAIRASTLDEAREFLGLSKAQIRARTGAAQGTSRGESDGHRPRGARRSAGAGGTPRARGPDGRRPKDPEGEARRGRTGDGEGDRSPRGGRGRRPGPPRRGGGSGGGRRPRRGG